MHDHFTRSLQRRTPISTRKDSVVWQLNAAFDDDKGIWADSLLGAVKGLSAEQAAWRPRDGERGIAQIVNHVTYWKNVALNKLDEGAVGENAPREDWQAVDDEAGWQAALAQLKLSQAALVQHAQSFSDEALDQAPDAEGWPAWYQVFLSVASHDAYHTGQIVMMRRRPIK